jgi:hypothetical protein
MIITNLLTNMVVLTLYGNYIPTNTPAFQQYAFQVMFTNAQSLAARWQLDQSKVSTNDLTRLTIRPQPKQIGATMEFGERYGFWVSQTGFLCFSDDRYRIGSDFEKWTNQALADRYGGDLKQQYEVTSTLTLEAARKIAESAMHAYGVPTDELGFLQPKLQEQMKVGDKLLPYYKFEWGTEKGRCKVHVSGVITNIVQFEFEGPDHLRLKPPPNYLELLGLATNTIFVKPLSPGKYEIFEPR